jgi:hypothetical protein
MRNTEVQIFVAKACVLHAQQATADGVEIGARVSKQIGPLEMRGPGLIQFPGYS